MYYFNYKKISCLLAMMTFIIALFCTTVAVPPSNFNDENAGTEENPFLISTLANLRWLSETVEVWGEVEFDEYFEEFEVINRSYFKQTANIDATETRDWNAGHGFSPIGTASINPVTGEEILIPFTGVYDGGGFIISSLYINPLDIPQYDTISGFYGMIIGATITNVNLFEIEILRGYTAGSIAAFAWGSMISFSGATGNISGDLIEVGGLIGLSLETSIENCYSLININVRGAETVGGLVASNFGSNIKNAFFKGEIVNESEYWETYMAGIAGVVFPAEIDFLKERKSKSYIFNSKNTVATRFISEISNVYAVITKSSDDVYGLASLLLFSMLTNSFWDTEISNIDEPFKEEFFGGIEDCFGLSSQALKQAQTYVNNGWDFDTIWTIHPDKNDGYPILQTMPDPIVSDNDEVNTLKPLSHSFAFPNPVRNSDLNIKWQFESSTNSPSIQTEISIFNVRGQLVNKSFMPSSSGFSINGENMFTWDKKDHTGQIVPSGVYFYRIENGNQTHTGRFLLVK